MSVVLDLRNTNKKIVNVARLSSKLGMEQIGKKVKELNETQIRKQQDNKEGKFKKYNKLYADKYKGGKRLPIDFAIRGHMLQAFGITGLRKGLVLLGFHGKDEKEKAGWNYKLRKFIGLNKKSRNKLFKWIYKKFIST